MNSVATANYEKIGTPQKALNQIKTGIWIYIVLLIFEGALRKWFLPQLASPLLIVRDPIAIWILFLAIHAGILKLTRILFVVVFAAIVSFVMTLLIGHGNLFVALFGLRIYLIHFPLMFVIGKVLTRRDIIKIGLFFLYLAIPMVLLNALQFNTPQSSWVNRGVGGDIAGAGFGGAMGYYRPPGTFSFTNGNVLYWTFTVAFLFYFFFNPRQISRWLLILATICIIFALPLSISRTFIFQVVLTLFFSFFILFRKPGNFVKGLMGFILISLILFVLNKIALFQLGTEVFMDRFNGANETEGGLEGVFLDRFLGGMVSAIMNYKEYPFFGYGIGLSSNVGASISASMGGHIIFVEASWARIIEELGILAGLTIILVRVNLVFDFTYKAFNRLKYNDILPWLLLSFGFPIVLQAQWEQPTSLGFSTLAGGLLFATLRTFPKKLIKPI